MLLIALLTLLSLSHSFLEMEGREPSLPANFRTFFFLRKLSPHPLALHPRREGKERLSPFHSLFILNKRKEEPSLPVSLTSRLDGTERLINNVLLSQFKHSTTFPSSGQYDTSDLLTEENEEAGGDQQAGENKTKKHVKHGIKRGINKTRKALKKTVKINLLTILLFIAIGLISGYIGYSWKSRASDQYIPLAK